MKKFEYATQAIEIRAMDSILKTYGLLGYELITVLDKTVFSPLGKQMVTLIFKKEIQANEIQDAEK